ncbi:MAG: hypothetical protein ACJ72S_08505 [Nitrososphaeraceae archaeon]
MPYSYFALPRCLDYYSMAKWLRSKLKDAGYGHDTMSRVFPQGAKRQGNYKRNLRKSEVHDNNVTTQQEQQEEDETEWMLNDPSKYEPY